MANEQDEPRTRKAQIQRRERLAYVWLITTLLLCFVIFGALSKPLVEVAPPTVYQDKADAREADASIKQETQNQDAFDDEVVRQETAYQDETVESDANASVQEGVQSQDVSENETAQEEDNANLIEDSNIDIASVADSTDGASMGLTGCAEVDDPRFAGLPELDGTVLSVTTFEVETDVPVKVYFRCSANYAQNRDVVVGQLGWGGSFLSKGNPYIQVHSQDKPGHIVVNVYRNGTLDETIDREDSLLLDVDPI